MAAVPKETLIVVHGGVDMLIDDLSQVTMENALAEAFGISDQPTRAAAVAVSHLERDPSFNAGLGSVLNSAGLVEVDAAVIDGATGQFGAVGAAPDITMPVMVALEVLRRRNGVLIAGEGASALAREIGVECTDLRTPEQIRLYESFSLGAGDAQSRFTGRPNATTASGRPISTTETVGALVVCGDQVVAASSTGGVIGKAPGRVGDAALLGAGIWADQRVGVLCSGMGEAMIELQLALRTAQRIHAGETSADAVRWAVSHAASERAAISAVVAVDRADLSVAAAHNGLGFPVYARDSFGTRKIEPEAIYQTPRHQETAG
jgi:beta-aspartyl-peptidase (threonine type)